MDTSKEVRQIPIEDIIPNRFQPRISFDEKALNDLSNSIKQHGIIQPLVVRSLGDKFEIIAGERRYKASVQAGLSTVPAIVTDMDDSTSAEVALVENVQRKDLTAIEEAKSYKNMLDRSNMTQEELAKKMGLSQSTIANKLRLLNLTNDVQEALMREKISERHARALLSVPKSEQSAWLNRIINERLTVRQLDLAIKDELTEKNESIMEVDNDIPIVNINPDVEKIINNAVDINSEQQQAKVDVFEGLTNINGNHEVENVKEEQQVEAPKSNPNIPNKFFNFLEDEEVNMDMTEPEVEKPSEVSDIFNFSPEFIQNENNSNISEINNEDKFKEFDLNNSTVSLENSADDIEMLDDEPLKVNTVNEFEKTINQTNEIQESLVDNAEVLNPDFEVNEALNVTSDTSLNESINNTSPDEENIDMFNLLTSDTDDIKIDPIPVVEGDNIIDPVKLFDTLEPDFYDKIKEIQGLDLKTAINAYRDLTNDLMEKGFNVSIEEIDNPHSYKIEIDIIKE